MALKGNVMFLLLMFLAFSSALPNGKRTVDTSGQPHQQIFPGTMKRNLRFTECTVENYECSDMSSENLINEFQDVQTNEGCKQRCVEASDCSW